MIGMIASGERVDKPVLKAGNKFHKMKRLRKRWPRVRAVAMNPVDHPFGGGNQQHVGVPSTVSRYAPPGRKVIFITITCLTNMEKFFSYMQQYISVLYTRLLRLFNDANHMLRSVSLPPEELVELEVVERTSRLKVSKSKQCNIRRIMVGVLLASLDSHVFFKIYIVDWFWNCINETLNSQKGKIVQFIH